MVALTFCSFELDPETSNVTRFVDLTYCTLAFCTVIVAFARQLVNPDEERTSSATACAANCAKNAVMANLLAHPDRHHMIEVARRDPIPLRMLS